MFRLSFAGCNIPCIALIAIVVALSPIPTRAQDILVGEGGLACLDPRNISEAFLAKRDMDMEWFKSINCIPIIEPKITTFVDFARTYRAAKLRFRDMGLTMWVPHGYYLSTEKGMDTKDEDRRAADDALNFMALRCFTWVA